MHAHGADPAHAPSYFLNCNPSGDGYLLDLLYTADNVASDCDSYADMSGSNNASYNSWFENSLHARNLFTGYGTFILYTNCHDLTSIQNTMSNQTPKDAYQMFLNVGNSDPVAITNVFDDNSISLNVIGLNLPAAYNGVSTIEQINGSFARYDVDATNIISLDSGVTDASHDLSNELFMSAGTLVQDLSTGTTIDVVTMNNRIIASGGISALSDTSPDWQDYSTNNYLPVGFESSAPTVNTQPETAKTVADGEYLTVSADFDQATSHQWQKDTVNIAGETSPVMTIKIVTADNAAVYRCVGTNAAGSTNSTGCTLTVGAATPLVINTQPVSVTVTEPAPAVFTCAATGNGTVTYQWYLGGVLQGGETSGTYTIDPTTELAATNVYCEVNDDTGTPLDSNTVTLTVEAVQDSLEMSATQPSLSSLLILHHNILLGGAGHPMVCKFITATSVRPLLYRRMQLQ